MIVPPDVDFLALLHPAQFASLVMSMFVTSACQPYFQINRGFPRKYLPMRLAFPSPSQWALT